jgi:predicted butyrate kinase (DUF1464 family)
MGTADKVCATALAVHDFAMRRGCDVADVSLIHLELGGAFSAAIAVEQGEIVDGLGRSSGPMGVWSPGARWRSRVPRRNDHESHAIRGRRRHVRR